MSRYAQPMSQTLAKMQEAKKITKKDKSRIWCTWINYAPVIDREKY